MVFSVLGLGLIGTLFVYSAAYHDSGEYLNKQCFWAVTAFAVFLAAPFIGYRTFLNVSYLLYVIAIILLVAVIFMGDMRLGARRWLSLGPLAVQPSEFAKLATVLAVANFLGSNHSWQKGRAVILRSIIMVVVPVFFIVRQPDLGTSLSFFPMIVAMLFLWGIRVRYLVMSAVTALISLPVVWELLKAYQQKRILVFLNPSLDPLGAGYTAIQSRIAVGSGGLFGKGYLAGTQSQLQFVPEHHTDFIFCVIGEEWGYAGTMLLLSLYGLLFHFGFQVMEQTTDVKAKLMITGILSVIFAQIFINIGMTFGMMPITGITLPLVSYGGSSLVTTAVGLGLILSVYKERSIF